MRSLLWLCIFVIACKEASKAPSQATTPTTKTKKVPVVTTDSLQNYLITLLRVHKAMKDTFEYLKKVETPSVLSAEAMDEITQTPADWNAYKRLSERMEEYLDKQGTLILQYKNWVDSLTSTTQKALKTNFYPLIRTQQLTQFYQEEFYKGVRSYRKWLKAMRKKYMVVP